MDWPCRISCTWKNECILPKALARHAYTGEARAQKRKAPAPWSTLGHLVQNMNWSSNDVFIAANAADACELVHTRGKQTTCGSAMPRHRPEWATARRFEH